MSLLTELWKQRSNHLSNKVKAEEEIAKNNDMLVKLLKEELIKLEKKFGFKLKCVIEDDATYIDIGIGYYINKRQQPLILRTTYEKCAHLFMDDDHLNFFIDDLELKCRVLKRYMSKMDTVQSGNVLLILRHKEPVVKHPDVKPTVQINTRTKYFK